MLAAIARGSSNAQISEEFFIGAATVKSHVSSILSKLGLRDRAPSMLAARIEELTIRVPKNHRF